ncbi:hypothetical protein [Paraburkholderia dilworthii]|uniref:Uncharacterized protein n=1 Tax=Paraburkholderia dilworthii TaxID=948106 RepID=A0ABW9DHW8_9BURK
MTGRSISDAYHHQKAACPCSSIRIVGLFGYALITRGLMSLNRRDVARSSADLCDRGTGGMQVAALHCHQVMQRRKKAAIVPVLLSYNKRPFPFSLNVSARSVESNRKN